MKSGEFSQTKIVDPGLIKPVRYSWKSPCHILAIGVSPAIRQDFDLL